MEERGGCLPTLLVAILMLVIVGGGFVAAEATAQLPSQPVTVAEGVTIRPTGEWQFGGRADDGTGVLLSRGAGSLFVDVETPSRPAREVLAEVLASWRAEPGTLITVGDVTGPLGLRPGQALARTTYAGTFAGIAYPVEGELTVVTGTSAVVIFDAWAGEAEFALVREEVDGMIREASIP